MNASDLKQESNKYRDFFKKSVDAMLIIEDYTFVDCNRAAARMLGYDNKNEMINTHPSELSPEYQPDGQLSFEKAKAIMDFTYERGAYLFEWIHRKKNGEDIPVEVSLTAISTKDKKILHTVWRDISARKNAEKERNRLREELHHSQKMEAIGLMAGGVAHDLNNILTGIVTYPEVLMYKLSADDPLRKSLNIIMESGKRAAAIVADLLTVARGVAASREIREMNEIITNHLVSQEQIFIQEQHPNVILNTDLTGKSLNINCSPIHIKKTIMNILNNAYEAINSNGVITISTSKKYIDKPLKNYNYINNGYYAVLTVKDNGIGILEEDIDRIFEPFYTKKFLGRSGTGLGLSIVWNTVKDHNGYINVSTGHSGTIFNLYFPVTENSDNTETSEIKNTNYNGNRENILIIDDDPVQREILSNILSMLNYIPNACSSGEEAIEYLQSNSVDLVILDMILGRGFNGKETYEKIIEMCPGQKAIIVSGYSNTSDVAKAQKLGAGTFIGKPYKIKTIGKSIQEELKK